MAGSSGAVGAPGPGTIASGGPMKKTVKDVMKKTKRKKKY